jgi:ABC-type proline/glycine betaine transport system permease subunit
MNGIFSVDMTGVKNALVITVVAAVVAGLVYITGVGDVFSINFHSLVNVVAMALFAGLISLGTHWLTDNNGKFLGVTQTQ